MYQLRGTYYFKIDYLHTLNVMFGAIDLSIKYIVHIL